MQKVIIRLSLLLLGIAFSLLFIEMVLRLFWKPAFLDTRFIRDDISWLSKNVVLNSFGYRDREFSLIKEKNVFRIYVLGDSYTYGWYIDSAQDSYPKLLERKLKEKFPDQKLEVINAARPGFNLKADIDRFKNEGMLFSPDLVILGINAQDLATSEFPPRFTKNKFFRDLRLYQATLGKIERARVAKKTDEEIRATYEDGSSQFAQAQEQFSELKEYASSIGAGVGIVIFPQYNPADPNGVYRYPQYHEQIKKIGQKYGFAVIDLQEAFSSYPDKRELVLNPIDPHPSAKANLLAGEYIADTKVVGEVFSGPKRDVVVRRAAARPGATLAGKRGIIHIPQGWVFFDRHFEFGTQKIFLPQSADKKVPYLEDTLKTAKAYTHEGWPGAKLEYNLPGGIHQIVIPRELYGYKVAGVSQISGFWRDEGATQSTDLSFADISITRDDKNILIEVKSKKELDLYKLTLDLQVKQFDLEEDRVVSFFSTKTFSSNIKEGEETIVLVDKDEVGSLPRFVAFGKTSGYAWVDDKMRPVDFSEEEGRVVLKLKFEPQTGAKVEVPYATSYEGQDFPEVEYL